MSDLRRSRLRAVCASGAALGLAMAMLLAMAPAYACTVLADVRARPNLGSPGTVIRIEGSGFDPAGGPVAVYWGGMTNGTLLATAPLSDGSFSIDVTVPLNAVAHSEYAITASQSVSPIHSGAALFRIPARAPVATAAPAAATPAPQPRPAAAPQAAPVPQPVHQPASAPVDASGFSAAGAPAFAPGGQPVAPLSQPVGAFGGATHGAGGQSPWILLPLAVVGLGLFSAGAAAALRQVKREGVRAPV